MVALFHDMIHKEIEVYVDDMIAKSKTEEEHLVNLRKLFKRLRKYQLRLNPAKCTFGVKSGKLLGFVVSQKGIEVVCVSEWDLVVLYSGGGNSRLPHAEVGHGGGVDYTWPIPFYLTPRLVTFNIPITYHVILNLISTILEPLS